MRGSRKWYELRLQPDFRDGEEEILNLLYRADEFAVFILRKASTTRILVRADDSNAMHFRGISHARLERLEWNPSLRYSITRYYRMRTHYALPIVQEVRPSILYSMLEELDSNGDGVECILACYAVHRDESYSISRWIMSKEGHEHAIVRALKGMFISGRSADKAKRLSPFTENLIEKARWKMRLKHFHTVIALGADSTRVLDMLEGALPYGLMAYKSEGSKSHESDLSSIVERSPMLKKCILSDIELASVIALPKDASTLRLVTADTNTFTTGLVIDADML